MISHISHLLPFTPIFLHHRTYMNKKQTKKQSDSRHLELYSFSFVVVHVINLLFVGFFPLLHCVLLKGFTCYVQMYNVWVCDAFCIICWHFPAVLMTGPPNRAWLRSWTGAVVFNPGPQGTLSCMFLDVLLLHLMNTYARKHLEHTGQSSLRTRVEDH